MNMAVNLFNTLKLRTFDRHQLEVNGQKIFADNMQTRGRQKMMNIRHATGERIFNRNHAKLRAAILNGTQSIFEGFARKRLPVRINIHAGHMRISTRLALIGNDLL